MDRTKKNDLYDFALRLRKYSTERPTCWSPQDDHADAQRRNEHLGLKGDVLDSPKPIA